jgi:transposase
VPVFGILKRGGRVYTVMVPDVSRSTLMPIIRERVRPDSVVYTDGFSSYAVLDVSGFHHQRIDHAKSFGDGAGASGVHINGIENFWSQAKRHLRRYNGIPRAQFPLFLKECEWRFNYGSPRELRHCLLDWMSLS